MEHAASQSFRAWLLYINNHRYLNRVVIDKTHLILTTTDYRPKLAAVNWLTVLICQIVYLTATLPSLMWKSFTDDLLINNLITIRLPTFRRNIGLQIYY
jgi:superfamily II DNA helicase RecQ